MRVSIIVPSRNERFLAQTVASILRQARGDVEVIPVLDGYWPEPYLSSSGVTHAIDWNDKRIRALHFGTPVGMRGAISAASQIATGDYLMKLDAHCDLSEGFDLVLREGVDRHTVSIPRRYRLDAERWCWTDTTKIPIDYHYLSYPFTSHAGAGLHGTVWEQRARARAHLEIDEEMSSQGSCWFMQRKHFQQRLYPMEIERYGNFVQEFQEVGLKTWLGGGRVIINKKAWYAHLHKGKTYGRGYFISKREMDDGQRAATDFWFYDRWEQRKHDLSWLIERFAPVPGWPEDWKERRDREERGREEEFRNADKHKRRTDQDGGTPGAGSPPGWEERDDDHLDRAGREIQVTSEAGSAEGGSEEAT
jgi:cellulose synthase/poly-beta-1,6-N-acetylglucosamine synthase-like glycosyltransferase